MNPATIRVPLGRIPVNAYVLPALLLLLVVGLALRSPFFLTSRNFQQILVQGSVLAVVAVGLTFVIINGDLDLSLGANVALSGVVASFGMTTVSHSVPVGILLGLGTGLGIGIINGLLSAVLRVPAFVATMGTSVIATGLALRLTNGSAVSGLPSGFGKLATTEILGLQAMVWWAVLVVAVGVVMLHRSAFGSRVYAVGGSHAAAYNAGISPARVRFAGLVIAGLLAGFGGVLTTSRVLASQAGDGLSLTLFATAAVILGGTKLSGGSGNMWLTVFGVLLISIVQNGLSILGAQYAYQQVAVGAVFVIAALTVALRRTGPE
jgi:ribose transport system permease protein